MSGQSRSLSVIVPTFNETQRFRAPLREIASYLADQPFPTEIVVIDDGSSDDTFELVSEIAAELPVPTSVHRYTPNRGKGHALKVGFAVARGQRLLFTDADLSTPISATASLLAALDQGADVAIGSRWLSGADVRKHQPRLREWLGGVFTLLVRSLIANVSDATCGFKAFEAQAGRDLFGHLRVDDWSFDAEILFIAKLRGYTLTEVPVAWEDREGTKVSILRDGLNAFIGLLRIRFNAATGRYDTATPGLAPTQVWRNDRQALELSSHADASEGQP